MAAEVMVTAAVTAMAVVAIYMLGDTVMAGVVMVGQAMLIADLLMATVMVVLAMVMVIQATVMLIMGTMAGGITVTGTPAMVAGGVATGTHMALELVGVSGQELVGFGSATSPRRLHEPSALILRETRHYRHRLPSRPPRCR